MSLAMIGSVCTLLRRVLAGQLSREPDSGQSYMSAKTRPLFLDDVLDTDLVQYNLWE